MVRTKRLFALLTAAFLAITAFHTSLAQQGNAAQETAAPITAEQTLLPTETPDATTTADATAIPDGTNTPENTTTPEITEKPILSTTPNCTDETSVSPTPTPAPTDPPQAPSVWEGLVSVCAGTTLYQDAQLQVPACTLVFDGIAYQMPAGESQEPLHILYTTDGLTLNEGYLPQAQCTPLAAPQPDTSLEATYILYGDYVLPALVTAPAQAEPTPTPSEQSAEPYEMQAYGFPGMPQGYELSAQEMAAKERLLSSGTPAQLAAMQPNVGYTEGYVLLQSATKAHAEQVAASYNATLESYAFGVALLRLHGATVQEAVAAAADPLTRLVAVEPNYCRTLEAQPSTATPSTESDELSLLSLPTVGTWAEYRQGDPFLASPASASYQYIHDAVNTWAAWGMTTGRSDVTVAILDSGINATHEELLNRVRALTPQDPSLDPLCDTSGHGTHAAGMIGAALGNRSGGAGIAPGVTLLSYPIVNAQDTITSLDIIYGLGMARACGAWVVLVGATGYVYNEAENEAVQALIDQGIAVVAPAGDNGSTTMAYPANYQGVICVAATNQSGSRAPCSNYASATLSAPGSAVLSSSHQSSAAYATMAGTSVAASVVAGASALYYSAIGTRDVNGDGVTNRSDVELLTKRLCASCTNVAGGKNGMGAGIVNVGKLFATLVETPEIFLADENGTPLQSATAVPTSATVHINGRYNNDHIVYTTDGSTPKVSGGNVSNGQSSSADVSLSLAAYPAGKVTVKALSVSAAGKTSAVRTLSFTIDNRDVSQVKRIEISRESLVCCVGKSVTLLATVSPATKSLKPTWQVVSGGDYATLNPKTGKLSVGKNAPAYSAVVVQATLGNVVQQAEVLLLPRIKSLEGFSTDAPTLPVKGKTLTAYVGATETTDIALSLAFEDGSAITPEEGYIQAVVAKPAYADATARSGTVRLRGLKLGKTAVTLIPANDTSKKLSFTLWVKQRVESIRLPGDGVSSIAIGKSKTLTATVLPSNATDKKLLWSIDGAMPTGITLKGNRLSCAKTAMAGTSFTLRCQSAADPDRYATQVVTICEPTQGISIRTADPRATFTPKGVLKEATLYTVPMEGTGYDIASSSPLNEAELLLTAEGVMGTALWSSSNPNVATVDAQSGLVSAVNAGSTTITCTATDGSNKKASVKVRVIVPASSVSLSASTQYASISGTMGDMPVLAMGKSLKLSAAYGATYGTPSIQKADWRITDVYYPSGDEYTHITEAALADGALSINASTGQLRVMPYQGLSGYFVAVQATAADKSCESPPFTLYVQPQTTKLTSMQGVFTLADTETGQTREEAYASTLTLAAGETGTLCFYTDSAVDNYTITSSGPAIASPYSNNPTAAPANRSKRDIVLMTKKGQTTEYSLVELGVAAARPGTAKITVRTNDGTNKSCAFTVRVIKQEKAPDT